ncbi:MAG: diguanylate cyclase, partial [Lachnospiraceae bacterium]|nr:diguanylate cyclase [Lachnospiraceae bacterium]
MKSHTLSGCHIIETLHDIGNHEYLRYAHNICHYHHERWTGGGYPEGISGDDIPICAQVVGLADVYDALTTERVYKEAIPHDQAVNMIINGESGSFSPRLIACFKHVAPQFDALAREYADGSSPKNEEFNVELPGPEYHSGVDTLQIAQFKYLSLLHHMDSTAMEIDLDKGLIHSIYSPHLDLAPVCACSTIPDAIRALYALIIPEEREKMKALMEKDIPAFFESGKRRQVHYFHILGENSKQPTPYQLTLLRPDPSDESRSMLNLWQRSNDMVTPSASVPNSTTLYPDDAVHGLLTGLLRYRNDRWFTLESSSAKLAELLGYTDEELYTKFHGHLIELVVPDDREMVRRVIDQQLSSSPSIALGYRLRHKDGNTIWVLNKSHRTVEADGNEYLYGTLTNITYSQKVQQELQANLERYQTILETMDSIIFEWNPETDRAYFSKKWEIFFGYPPLTVDVMKRLSTASHFHPEDLPKIIRMFQDMKYGNLNYQLLEVRIANANGRYHWIRMRKMAVRDEKGKLLKMVGLLISIDDEKQATKALREQAERDSLTKLLNKQTGKTQIETYLSSYSEGAICALIIIDLDNFKYVNDNFGHMFGDAVLAQAAKEIKRLFRAQDISTRIGGDEFMILMKGISDRALIESRCRQLISVCRNLFRAQLQNNPLGCSIGIALSPEHGLTYNELYKRAD